LLEVVDEESVEEICVGGLNGGEVEVLVNGSTPTIDNAQSTLTLSIHLFNNVGNEAGKILGYAIFWAKRGAWDRPESATRKKKVADPKKEVMSEAVPLFHAGSRRT
jgi:hypothetical protein